MYRLKTAKHNLKHFSTTYREISRRLTPLTVSRDQSIARLAETHYDLLVVGGGASGAGVLLDAQMRGLKCALIEKNDFASITSSRSTKLIHGGIRYLEQAIFEPGDRIEKLNLVYEALKERDFMLSSASFANKPVMIRMPSINFFQNLFHYSGMVVYYILYRLSLGKERPILGKPQLHTDSSIFFEGSFNDSRQAMLSLLTAISPSAGKPAEAVNYCEAKEVLRVAGKVRGVRAVDSLTGRILEINAKMVVNATGIFADDFALATGKSDNVISCAKGIHVVFERDTFNFKNGRCIPKTSDGRILFILPFHGRWLAGTTDEFCPKTEKVKETTEEVDYLIKEIAIGLDMSEEKLRAGKLSVFAGIRPLVKQNDSCKIIKS